MSDVPSGYRAALAQPVARRLWLASLTSSVGDYIALGALLFLAADRTGLVLGAAAVVAVGVVPSVLAGILGGRWFDRFPRAPALAALQALGGGVVLLPILIDGTVVVIVTAAGLAAVRVATASIRSGAMADAVSDEHRGPLVALLTTTDQATQVAGYLTGAGLYVAVGADLALVLDAVTFAISAALLLTLPIPSPTTEPPASRLTTGLEEIGRHPTLRLLALLALATGLVGSSPEVLAPAVAAPRSPWRPVVLAAAPLGQAVTMLLLGRTRLLHRPRNLLVHLGVLAGALALASVASSPAGTAAANLLIGGGTAWVLGAQVLFLRLAPRERMAQVTGAMIAGLAVADGIGSLALAALADRAGPAAAYLVGGVAIALALVLGAWLRARSEVTRALDRADAAG
ncbi:MAG: MFS transporter [Nitriliruptoraceae bacterium]